jgi:nicotinate-nucleotide pyrophosphorylase (carboxylating)
MFDFDEQLQILLEAAYKEDLGDGDHSALSCIPADAKGEAVLKIKEDGILAGVKVAENILKIKAPDSHFIFLKKDGDRMQAGEQAFLVKAPVHVLLQAERLVLNCMQRMSGIATLTGKYVNKLEGFKTKILDTRKTTPNFRLLEKEAVRIGGALNHRFGLFDSIILKDNHIDYCGGIGKAIERASEYVQFIRPGLKIEIETRNLDEVKQVLSAGKVDRIMLDNFSPDQLREAIKIIDKSIETEASGGINMDNLIAYAQTGVDYISVGALIHQARSLDMSMKAYQI